MNKTDRLRMSFEFFPPKTSEGILQLKSSVDALSLFSPHFFSVTFGAGGSTRDGTIETVKMLQQRSSIPLVPHLTCVGFSRADIIYLLKIYEALGINRLVALRGDLPSKNTPEGEVHYAYDLVTLIREETGDYFQIEVAAYPEYHPQAQSTCEDIINLKKKIDAGANAAITQYFFNSDAYFYFIEECAKQQIFVPIVPGVMPIVQFNKLAHFSDLCGAEIPRWLRKRLASFGNDIESLQSFGLDVIYQLCEKLIEGGAPGLHVYTLNQAEASLALFKMFYENRLFHSTNAIFENEQPVLQNTN